MKHTVGDYTISFSKNEIRKAKSRKEFVDQAAESLKHTGIDKKKLEEIAGKEYDEVMKPADEEETPKK